MPEKWWQINPMGRIDGNFMVFGLSVSISTSTGYQEAKSLKVVLC